jgi:hypothetical protein
MVQRREKEKDSRYIQEASTVAIVKGRTVCIGYGVMTRYRSKGPRCVGNGRVV